MTTKFIENCGDYNRVNSLCARSSIFPDSGSIKKKCLKTSFRRYWYCPVTLRLLLGHSQREDSAFTYGSSHGKQFEDRSVFREASARNKSSPSRYERMRYTYVCHDSTSVVMNVSFKIKSRPLRLWCSTERSPHFCDEDTAN